MLADSQPAPEPAPDRAPPPLSSTCPSCGAQTAYAPGTTALRCGSCGTELQIAETGASIQEHSYDDWRAKHGDLQVASIAGNVMQCRGCGATTETVDLAGTCQFCGGALIAVSQPEGVVPPEAVLPFHVDRAGARAAFTKWVSSRRFAPNALKKVGSTEGLQGTYVPHWTFDAATSTDYTGQRGDHYYTTETRQVSDGKGGTRTETYQQQHTRWSHASGRVARAFDDILVPGSQRLETKQLHKMGPWKLEEARPFQPEYLTGYSALRYDVDPQEGAKIARSEMRRVIENDVEHDIGGDEQRVSNMDVTYANAMFKLLLMPLWIASYLYAGKTFQVMVNANTGEVVGKRPYSVWKIVSLVLAIVVVIAVVVAVLASQGSSGG